MPDKTWKSVERRVCRYLGTERLLHEGRKGEPDGISDIQIVINGLAIQVKHRKSLPSWIADAWGDTEQHTPDGKIPIVCLHQKQQKIEDTYVITKLKYLKGVGE